MNAIIRDLLQSPSWVIATFLVVYTFILAFIVWKISSWYKGISGWNKHRTTEKSWKDRVKVLEKENTELKEQLEQSAEKEDATPKK